MNTYIIAYLHGYVLYKCTLYLIAHLIVGLHLVSVRGMQTRSLLLDTQHLIIVALPCSAEILFRDVPLSDLTELLHHRLEQLHVQKFNYTLNLG